MMNVLEKRTRESLRYDFGCWDLLVDGETIVGMRGVETVERFLSPGPDQCRWCKAKAKCPALDKFVTETVGASFEDLTKTDVTPETALSIQLRGGDVETLAKKMAACGLIEKWIKAVRGKVEIEGCWDDEEEARIIGEDMKPQNVKIGPQEAQPQQGQVGPETAEMPGMQGVGGIPQDEREDSAAIDRIYDLTIGK